MAVEVRTWFQKELAVDMPVLRILGGASVCDLVDNAVDKLSSGILSRHGAESISTSTVVNTMTHDRMSNSGASDDGSMRDSSTFESEDLLLIKSSQALGVVEETTESGVANVSPKSAAVAPEVKV